MLVAEDCSMWGKDVPAEGTARRTGPDAGQSNAPGSSICSDACHHQMTSFSDANLGPTHHSLHVHMCLCMYAGIPSFIHLSDITKEYYKNLAERNGRAAMASVLGLLGALQHSLCGRGTPRGAALRSFVRVILPLSPLVSYVICVQ